ncbi:MAG: FG-GAP repeat protein, partial [Rhodothermales bacterium]
MPGKVCSLFLAVLALTVAGSVHARQPRVAVGGDETSTGFGRAVALANEEMFIGEPFNVLTPGAVYVFAWDAPSGSWIERGRLTASDAVAGDRFGQAVAVDGDRLLVGAPFQVGSTGAAYIFERDATTGAWVEQAKLTARDGVAPDLLGEAVALHGNTALVGASFRNTRAGAAYVFERDEVTGAWTEQTRLVGHDTQPGDRFGFAVALWEDHALIGAYAHNNQEGAVYAFWRDATERWAEQAKLVSPQVQPGDRFGYALAFREDEAVVGAPRHGGFLGAVFVTRYDSTSGRWIEQARLTPGTGRSGDRFGRSVSGDGETLWVGAPFAD